MKILKKIIHTILSISGFIPENMTVVRAVFMFFSLWFSLAILPKYPNVNYAMTYFAFSTIVYIGFIYFVLPEHGFRLKMIEKFGEEKAYLYYEGFLAFAFLHNGIGLSYISQSSAGSGVWEIFLTQLYYWYLQYYLLLE